MHLFILNFQECNFRTKLNRLHSHILSYSFTPPLPQHPHVFILTGDVEGYPESVCWYSEGLRRDGGEIRPPYLDSRISSDG